MPHFINQNTKTIKIIETKNMEKTVVLNSSEKLRIIKNTNGKKYFIEYIFNKGNEVTSRIIQYHTLNKMETHFLKMPNKLTDNIIKSFKLELSK